MVASPKIVEQVISTFQRAVEANCQTPTRTGNVILLSPTEADEVMIAADLHGNRHNFNALLKAAALDESPRRSLVMQEVCHGGPSYPSGLGCMSHLMLEDIARLKADYPQRFHYLLSNHELAELTDFPIIKGGQLLNLSFRSGLEQMYGSSAEQVRTAAMEFIRSCPLAVRLSNKVFICHSAPENVDQQGFDIEVLQRPLKTDDLKEKGAVFQLVWGRDFRSENGEAFAKLVEAELLIHGHEPCPQGYQVPNRWQVILDSSRCPACYVVLKPGEDITQKQLVDQIQFIE